MTKKIGIAQQIKTSGKKSLSLPYKEYKFKLSNNNNAQGNKQETGKRRVRQKSHLNFIFALKSKNKLFSFNWYVYLAMTQIFL